MKFLFQQNAVPATNSKKRTFPRRLSRAPGSLGLARGLSEMSRVLALNTNLSRYLIFSCGPVCFLLNKLHGHRKQGPDLTQIPLASQSSISRFFPDSVDVANWTPHEGQR